MMNENLCVCCGEVIPKGMQICKKCEAEYQIEWGDSIIQKIYEKGFRDGEKNILISDNSYNVTVKVRRSELHEIFTEGMGNFLIALNEKLKVVCNQCIMNLADYPDSSECRCQKAENNCENCIFSWLDEIHSDDV